MEIRSFPIHLSRETIRYEEISLFGGQNSHLIPTKCIAEFFMRRIASSNRAE